MTVNLENELIFPLSELNREELLNLVEFIFNYISVNGDEDFCADLIDEISVDFYRRLKNPESSLHPEEMAENKEQRSFNEIPQIPEKFENMIENFILEPSLDQFIEIMTLARDEQIWPQVRPHLFDLKRTGRGLIEHNLYAMMLILDGREGDALTLVIRVREDYGIEGAKTVAKYFLTRALNGISFTGSNLIEEIYCRLERTTGELPDFLTHACLNPPLQSAREYARNAFQVYKCLAGIHIKSTDPARCRISAYYLKLLSEMASLFEHLNDDYQKFSTAVFNYAEKSPALADALRKKQLM